MRQSNGQCDMMSSEDNASGDDCIIVCAKKHLMQEQHNISSQHQNPILDF